MQRDLVGIAVRSVVVVAMVVVVVVVVVVGVVVAAVAAIWVIVVAVVNAINPSSFSNSSSNYSKVQAARLAIALRRGFSMRLLAVEGVLIAGTVVVLSGRRVQHMFSIVV